MRSWAITVLGALVVVAAGWWFLRPGTPPIETTLPAAEGPATVQGGGDGGAATTTAVGATTSTTAAGVVVQAAGAVVKPGVYDLPVGARVDDLVDAAGGLTKRADRNRVNLAAPLSDGERVWLPSEGEESVPDVVAGAGGGGSPSGAGTGGQGADGGAGVTPAPTSPVDLNAATAEELDVLPGVGPATASAILSYREEHGRFGSVDELLEVRGIGEAKLDQLRPLVRV
jgi:competence protein ComEA